MDLFAQKLPVFAEVILPLPLPGTFTYRLPAKTTAQPGCRVMVQFGKQKIYTGVIASLHHDEPKGFEVKDVLELLDTEPVVTSVQLAFFEWIRQYYMCDPGDVLQAALPAGLKLSSESFLSFNDELDLEDMDLSEREQMIVAQLRSGDVKLNELSALIGVKSPYKYLKSLREKQIIQVFEQVKDKYTPKKEMRVRLTAAFVAAEALETLLATLESKTKQLDVLLAYLRLVDVLEDPRLNELGVSKKRLAEAGAGASSLKTLEKNGVFELFEHTVSRLEIGTESIAEVPVLSPTQEQAKRAILQHFEQKPTVLLHGITGSGKTEIFISLIQDILDAGGQVLYLLPEIALTTQIIKRLHRIFGQQFGVYHSRYSDNERVEVWQKVLDGTYRFIVGVRSAIFLPFSDLSLIIVDEEHENAFKQYDPAPRYHARDCALYLASLFHAKTLLGTATPSLETYQNALEGKYGLVTLNQRFGNVQLPEMVFANLAKERKQRKIKGHFTSVLLEGIGETLSREEQVILFQNRRGYAPFVNCEQCGYVPKCANCDVSLTYHMQQNLLICHYCGYKTGMITDCIRCSATEIRTVSFGTEKLEEDLAGHFPEAHIQRMDLDTTRSKYSYQRIIDAFEEGETDILVGTQMVTKGLDFDQVSLVGIFDADRMIHFPDFRSHERAFQMILQVSGRAGRKRAGKVIIQTSDPTHPVLKLVERQSYEAFFRSEIQERERFHYPPFYRLIQVTFQDIDRQVAGDAAVFYSKEVKRYLGEMRVIGPVAPIVSKIRRFYLYQLTIKIEKNGLRLSAVKEILLTSRNMLLSQRSYKGVRVIFDVDPV